MNFEKGTPPPQGQNNIEDRSTMNAGVRVRGEIIEEDIHKTLWAIRRMLIHCQGKCFGVVNNKKCGIFIDNKTPGEAAPSFWSYREYNGKQIP